MTSAFFYLQKSVIIENNHLDGQFFIGNSIRNEGKHIGKTKGRLTYIFFRFLLAEQPINIGETKQQWLQFHGCRCKCIWLSIY